MPTFQITIVNDEFRSTSESNAVDLPSARAEAIKGVMEVGAEQITSGKTLFGAEVTVGDGEVRERFIVSIGVSPLK